MNRFTAVPAKITAKGLETTEIDAVRGNLVEEHNKKVKDSKHFIKANMKGLRQQEMEVGVETMAKQAQVDKKREFQTRYNAKIPAYLQRFRKEEEQEKQRTLQEIEMNKRPPGTRVVTAQEKTRVLQELQGRKQFLETGITNMSVTQYTNRAQNQYKGYAENLDDIDRTITVFGRKNVYVAP